MQTPPSSPTSGKFKLFYYNVLNVSFAANFKLRPNLYRIALIFINPFYHYEKAIDFATLFLP